MFAFLFPFSIVCFGFFQCEINLMPKKRKNTINFLLICIPYKKREKERKNEKLKETLEEIVV